MTELPDHALDKLLADAEPLLDDGGSAPSRLGKYRVLGELGRGGMGVVYEAEDTELGRRVALKVLALPPGATPDLSERFQREAQAAARLNHPNIAAVYEATGDAIAMQLVDGIQLTGLPRDDTPRLVRLVRDAARAVHYAHERGIVHRDLKPHNLMVEGPDDRVMVMDFGLAKETSSDSSLSVSGHVLGTPGYMAPEQAEGRPRDVDGRTDVYGLGATLLHLLVGRPPFVGADVLSVLRKIVEVEPPRLQQLGGDVPRDLETVVLKCLSKEPARRYASAAELADDLTRWLDGEPVTAQRPSLGYRVGKFVRRRRALVGVAAVSLVVVLVALANAWQQRARQRASASALRLSETAGARLDDARTFQRLGQMERRAEQLALGLAACRDFLAEHDVALAHLLRGRLLWASGQDVRASQAFSRALALEPDLVAARLERGLLAVATLGLALQGTPAHAVERMDEAQRAHRQRALDDLTAAVAAGDLLRRIDALHAQAEVARFDGDLSAAREHLEEVLRLDPLRVQATNSLGAVELAEGHGDRAWALALSAMDVPRGLGPGYMAQAGQARSDADDDRTLVRLAGVVGELFDFGADLGSGPSQALSFGQRSLVQARSAAEQTVAGDHEAALAAWDRAVSDADAGLRLDPQLAILLNNRAVYRAARLQLLEQLGRSAAAETERAALAADLQAVARRGSGDAVLARNWEALSSATR